MTILEFECVTLVADDRTILERATLSVDAGEIVALAGPSGSGKTSLVRLALGLIAPSTGKVRLRGRDVSAGGRILVPPEARGLAVVFQDLALFPHLSVRRNLEFGLEARRVEAGERDRRIRQMLARVGLPGFERRMPGSLSGGERQRVAIARALVDEPDLVLFDEPLASLDVALRAEMRGLLRALLVERGTAALYVTHDRQEIAGLAPRVVVLERGRVVQEGALSDLAAHPNTDFVRAFAAS